MKLYQVELTEKVSDWLRSKKIKFTLDDDEFDNDHYFEFWIGSGKGGIMLEYSPIESNVMPTIQIFSKVDNGGNSLYESIFEYNGDFENLTSEIEELIDYIKLENRIIAKIESKIDEIKALCDELQIDSEQFISVNYEF
jgi:hypothetical protein